MAQKKSSTSRQSVLPELQEAFVRKTERLVIRALTPADFDIWEAAFRAFDPPKNKWDAGGMEDEDLRRVEFDKMLKEQSRQRKQDKYYHFGIFLKKSGRFIGATALMDISRGVFHNAYLGYWIGNIHWGRGYAQEATRATIEIGFEDLRIHRVEAGIAPGNKKSIALAKAIGMRREGLSRKRVFLEDAWQDLVLYAMTTEDVGFSFDP